MFKLFKQNSRGKALIKQSLPGYGGRLLKVQHGQLVTEIACEWTPFQSSLRSQLFIHRCGENSCIQNKRKAWNLRGINVNFQGTCSRTSPINHLGLCVKLLTSTKHLWNHKTSFSSDHRPQTLNPSGNTSHESKFQINELVFH
jgi:hypothetical protein